MLTEELSCLFIKAHYTSAFRQLPLNSLLVSGVYIIMWGATRERFHGAHLTMLQISHVESTGDFIFSDHQPIVVEPWSRASAGKGDQKEMVDYSCVFPFESYLARSCEEYWSFSFFHRHPAVSCVLPHIQDVFGNFRNWWLEMSLVWQITLSTYQFAFVTHRIERNLRYYKNWYNEHRLSLFFIYLWLENSQIVLYVPAAKTARNVLN